MRVSSMRLAGGRAVRREEGAVLVEFGLFAFMMLSVGLILSLFGRTVWCYHVTHKAAHEAARYLARVPMSERLNGPRNIEMRNTAIRIANQVMRDGGIGENAYVLPPTCSPVVSCAGTGTPTVVGVTAGAQVFEGGWFSGYDEADDAIDLGVMSVKAQAAAPYIGA